MTSLSFEPRDGDVVVVRASTAPDGRLDSDPVRRYAVVQWGTFELVSARLERLSKEEAVFEARHCASERGHDAWDSTGKTARRLPRLPLVYRDVADTYAVSVDVTDYSDAGAGLAWKSMSHLSASQALAKLLGDGVSVDLAKGLLGRAPKPLACT